VAGQMSSPVLTPPAAAPRREAPPRRRTPLTPGLLVLPALVFLAVFFVYPLWGLVLRSLNPTGEVGYDVASFTLDSYLEAFGDSAYWVMFRTTVELAVAATVATVVIAYPVAYLMSRVPRRLGRIMLLAVMFPYFTSILIRLYAFTQILSPLGLHQTTAGAVIGMVAYLLPYMIVMLYAAMIALDSNLGPAARTLGARPWRVFTRIFFPLTKAGLTAAALFVFVVSLGFYITPVVLGSTTEIVLSTYIQQKVNLYQWGVASAMGIALLVITLVLFAVAGPSMTASTALTGGTGKGVSSGTAFRWTRGNSVLGLWSLLALAFLLLPLLVVVWASFTSQSYLQFPPQGYSLRWYEQVFSDSTWLEAAWLSLRIGVLTALICVVLGLTAAYGMVRGDFRGKTALRVLFYTPLIVPVVLVGASLFGFEVRLRINGSVLGYVIGHVVLCLPLAVVILSTAMASVPRGTELAARTLGAGPWRTFRRVTFPALAPSAAAAAMVCFLMSWDEPVLSLFLASTEQTLPVKYLLFLRQQILPTMAAVGTLLMVAVLAGYLVLTQGARALEAARRRHERHREETQS
jgi:putative spermidine/putrescine transport system permease protein